ncbi:protein TPX2 [Cornus florida]|uniref:protein TPX2 n=1 Tax=Cornus florida TaxID=4283 RepID=UPI0028A15827|nr:protein TPX2 [Cornus florida]
MDEEMEERIELTFTVVEIDLDYEFDAARYFDFSREESLAETREAELWFESAGSYPPSPFVMRLAQRENILLENVNVSPKTKEAENTTLPDNDSDAGLDETFSITDANRRDSEEMDEEIFTNLRSGNLQAFQNQFHIQPQQLTTGSTFYNHMNKDDTKAQTKSNMKPSFPRTSTLMKPTASQLAKQNQPHQVANPRFEKLFGNNERNSNNPCGIEIQAAKRQKLEGGHLRKVGDTKQQTNLVHKAPKRDGTVDGNSLHPKVKLTIPREPDLETAHRAQRRRPKNSTEAEHVTSTSTACRFKALPLNRKILEAPSLVPSKRSTMRLPETQVFHLKTSERAMQHTSAISSSSIYSSNSDKVFHKPSANPIAESGNGGCRRSNFVDAPKQQKSEPVHYFKARPLNRKIFLSKGDIGVFRNSKREITVPMEFNFHTEKRVPHNPPIDLFNKLSLTEHQPNGGSQLKSLRPTCIPTKGSKENRLGSFQQEHEIKHLVKEKPLSFGGKQIQFENDGAEGGPFSGMNRSLGIR